MPLDELTAVVPERDWNELITGSMRRGRVLRRRRQALVASPLAAALAVIVAIPLSGVFDKTHDGLARLHTTNVGPAQSFEPTPGPSGAPSPDPVQFVVPEPGTMQPESVTPHRRGGSVAPAPTAVREQQQLAAHRIHQQPAVLAYADVTGDATPQASPNAPATPSATAASDPTLDITRMSVTADRRSIRIAMDLLAGYRTNGYYLAYLTDARTGCTYTVLLGGAYHDDLWWTCGSHSGGSYIGATSDTSRHLVATLTLSELPGGARPGDALTSISGETRLVHPADGQWPYDEAPTSKELTLP